MPPPKLRRSSRKATTPLYQPPKAREEPCVVDSLPDELIREIFKNVHNSWEVPVSLFLVSRRWNEIATSLSLLRSVIHIDKPQEYASMCTEYQKPVFCTSSDQLTGALACIGSAKFDLVIAWLPPDLALRDHPLSTRCRYLELDLDPADGAPPVDLPDMVALQELVVGLWPPILELALDAEGHLFERLEACSLSLKSLSIRGWLPASLSNHRQLLQRLTEIKLMTTVVSMTLDDSKTLCTSLTNVETFTWQLLGSTIETLVSVPASTKNLTFMNIPLIPIQDYKNLVTLLFAYSSRSEKATRTDLLLHFPSLHALELYGNWCEIPRIRAPVLRRLTLGHTCQSDTQIKELLPLIQIKAESIHISNHMSDTNLVSLLGGVWSQVRELHLACLKKREAPGPTLTRALSGTSKKSPLCPQLWSLTIQLTSSEQENPGLIRRSLQKLKQVIDSRKRKGFGSLVWVHCGWLEDMDADSESSGAWINVL